MLSPVLLTCLPIMCTKHRCSYWAMVLQSDAVQSVALLNVSAQVDDVLQSLLGRAPPEPLPASRPQLVALPVLLRQVVLRRVVSKQVCMASVGRLHHGGWLESIVLAPAGHFHFPARTRTEISILRPIVRLRNTFSATSLFRKERPLASAQRSYIWDYTLLCSILPLSSPSLLRDKIHSCGNQPFDRFLSGIYDSFVKVTF